MKQFGIFLFLFFPLIQLSAQAEIPQDFFKSPLEIPLTLAGSFGELRSNHFHSGMDLKTNQQTGLNVLAAGPGYISRIKVQQWGFGKAIYIQHPNGYTTVYGHLKEFSPEIKAYVRKRQYEKESFEVELFPSENELPVNEGQLIALSGNTGSSGGPHVHFEIRDNQQRPMNPMLFGLDIKDTRKPIITGLYAYPVGGSAYVNNVAERQKIRLIPLQDGTFKTETINAFGKIGFGISTVDQMNFEPNKNGAYKIETICNGSQHFEMIFDKFSFAESGYINRMIDYSYYKENDKRIQKLFLEPNNELSIYSNVVNKGLIDIGPDEDYIFIIKVSDFAGNSNIIRIPIEAKQSDTVKFMEPAKTDYFAAANQSTVFEEGIFDVYIPKDALYEDTYLNISIEGETIHLHEATTPLHKNLTLGFDVGNYSEEDRKQLCIVRTYPWGSKYYVTTRKEGNRFTTHTKTFGTYTLGTDDVPPKIVPVNFSDGKWISNNETLSLKITDDFSGISAYRATVNGKFILMEYNHKTDLITYEFSDGIATETENKLKVIVTDNVGNSSVFEAVFYRK
ncbi:MAG TPA: M23 family metallopeptidase [Flavobacteriaceae bacterium]|nr:M23 family metallopeptidase [Flavobacteriaceae bacterium]